MASKRIDVVHKNGQWVAESGDQVSMSGDRKTDVVREVAQAARRSGEPTSVRIHGMNGRIQEERSYGGADSRRRKG